MKVTAILPDDLILETKSITKSKSITDALKIALTEWINLNHIKNLNSIIEKSPLKFDDKFNAHKIRNINRKK